MQDKKGLVGGEKGRKERRKEEKETACTLPGWVQEKGLGGVHISQ